MRPLLAILIICGVVASSAADATDVSRTALTAGAQAKPNVIFGMDNSGSMDDEVLLSGTNDGAFYWDPALGTAWTATGDLRYQADAEYTYLFPNGCNSNGAKHQCDNAARLTLAPIPQLAPMRSSTYNPIYYDPMKTYAPWAPGTIANTLRTFPDADPAAALSDPLFTPAMALNTTITSKATDFTFRMVGKMIMPAGSSYAVVAGGYGGSVASTWTTVSVPTAVPTNAVYDVSISYYPATYWFKEACTVNDIDCAAVPGSVNGVGNGTLKRYEIKPGTTFPSGRSYADEMQNFANWFSYARKRRLMLASSMGQVMNSLNGMRVGVVKFNGAGTVKMYDTDAVDPKLNGRVVAGTFYNNASGGGTPTRDTLKFIGDQFINNKTVVTSSCQRNAAIIVTDGFAGASSTTPPAYNAATYGRGSPYATTWSASSPDPTTTNYSLADIALSYYTNNLRPDLTAGGVPVAPASNPDPAADRNPNIHMNTYAVTLGPVGKIWPARTNPYVGQDIDWPNPTANLDPMSIDDLWHATINGRGTMLQATNPVQAAAAVQAALGSIMDAAGAQSGLAFSTPNLAAGDNFAYAGIFHPVDWSGDIIAMPVDLSTGVISATPSWSASGKLMGKSWGTRRIFSFDGSQSRLITANEIGARINPGNVYGATSGLVDFIRGSRANEGNAYRLRTGLMGGVINATPVADKQGTKTIVFGATNDGMVHALDANDGGNELWAYVPGFTHAGIGAQSKPAWQFQTLLDGTPTIASVNGTRLLVGGAGTAGTGYYALDVTAVDGSESDAALLARVKWEFPNSRTPTATLAKLGASMGKPVVVRSASRGWVALVTSGYNSTGDGKGRLFVLNALTGAVLAEIATTAGTPTNDAGLAQVSGWVELDGTTRFAYGGDLLGNLWRFDIEAATVLQVATLTNAAGGALSVTAAPEFALLNGRRTVFVGTGRMLGATDLPDTSVNTMFAIWDDSPASPTTRARLAARTITVTAGVASVSGSDVAWSTQRGWFVDLPAGEKASTDPSLAFGILAWTTNQPSAATCTASSKLYLAAAATGLQLPDSTFGGRPFYSVTLSSSLASQTSMAQPSSGTLLVGDLGGKVNPDSVKLNVPSGVTPRKTVWREIRR